MNYRDFPPHHLHARFHELCLSTDSDISQHLGTLWGLARQCEHVTEMGIRTAVSTTALLLAQPETLVCYDIDECPFLSMLRLHSGRTAVTFIQADSRQVEIAPTDMLHIDTVHAYACLSVELRLHAHKVRKWIALHDTEKYGERGDDGAAGLNKAITELVAGGKWREWGRFRHNYGMTILQRIAEE